MIQQKETIDKIEDLAPLGIKRLIIELTHSAYKEARQHEYDSLIDPDEDTDEQSFNDTECYKIMKQMEIL